VDLGNMIGKELPLQGLLASGAVPNRFVAIQHRGLEHAQFKFNRGRDRAVGEEAIHVRHVYEQALHYGGIQHIGKDRVVQIVDQWQTVGGRQAEYAAGELAFPGRAPIRKDGKTVWREGSD
jgi:hypothetical protein